MSNHEGPRSSQGPISRNLDGPASVPPSVIPSPVRVDPRVAEFSAPVPASVRGAVSLSPHARNIDSLKTDIRYLTSRYRDVHPEISEATAISADETRMIMHFLFDARTQIRQIHLAPFAKNKIGQCHEAMKQQLSAPQEDVLFNHVVLARQMEDGIAEKGYRWAFQSHDEGVVYTPEMLRTMHAMIKVRGFDIKQDVDNILQTLRSEYATRPTPVSREQYIADYAEIVEAMGHLETYGETERPSVPLVQGQKTRIQQFFKELGNAHDIAGDAARWREILEVNLQRIDEPASFFHLESMQQVVLKARNQPLSAASVRYAVSAINRYLMQGYYAAFEMKLLGKNV